MALGFGYNSYIGVGTEGTYGTPATRTVFVEHNGETLAQADDVIEGNSVYRSEQDVDNFTQARKTVGGNFTLDVRYEGAEKFVLQAMGTSATTTMITGSAYKHIFSLADDLPVGLCLEVDRDVSNFLYHGVKINTMTLSQDNTGILNASFDVICEDEGTVAATTPSFSTTDYFMFDDAVVAYDGTTQAIKSLSLSLNNSLTTDRYQFGSRLTKEPERSGRIEVTGDMEVEFDGTINWSRFKDAGTGSLSATYTGATISGTAANLFVIKCPHVRLSGGVPNVSDSGMISVTVPFKAYADGTALTSRLMQIEWTNTASSV